MLDFFSTVWSVLQHAALCVWDLLQQVNWEYEAIPGVATLGTVTKVCLAALGLAVIYWAISQFAPKYHKRKGMRLVRDRMDCLASSQISMTPENFMRLRNASAGGRGNPHVSNRYNFAGVYILFNQTRQMFYVGQAQRVFDRVYQHFTGKGNGDVYADYKYGQQFLIQMIALKNPDFSSLNELERYMIHRYDAYYSGYNKTRGNR